MKHKGVKVICCFLMVIVIASGITMENKAEDDTEGKWNGFTYSGLYEEEFGTISHSRIVVSYEGGKRELTIPKKINGRRVVEVTGLYDAKNLRILHIPNGVDVSSALSSARKLKKIIISKNNKKYKVKNNVLLNKKGTVLLGYPGGYRTVKIPDSVIRIDEQACAYANFEKIRWGKNTKIIGSDAFSGNNKLKTIVINKKVEVIENYAFSSCRNLKKVVLGPGVKEVQFLAFFNCKKLKSVYVYNEDCEIDDSEAIPKGATIYGKKGSTAEKYAQKFKMKFKSISDM